MTDSPEPEISTPLRVVDLHGGYGDAVVVRNINLHVGKGEIVALLGPNGSGKSTMLLTLAGELRPISGSVITWGDASEEPLYRRARKGLGFVPEERSVLMSMSVKDNLLLGRGGVEGACEIFPELAPLLSRRAGLLSGGEQQMLSLGRALAAEPSILLVDELSLGLAPLIVERLMLALRSVAREREVAVLLVEQQVRRALDVADRWYLLRHGTIVAEGDSSVDPSALEDIYLSDALADDSATEHGSGA